jgi:hypothetical protein
MNRPLFIVPLVVLLGALAGWWGWTHFQWAKTREWVGYSGEACSNRLHAAQLLAERLGARTRSLEHFGEMARMGTHGTLVVTANAGELTRTQTDAVLAWTRAGGHLLVEVEAVADADQGDPARRPCDRGGCGCQHHNLLAEFRITTSEPRAQALPAADATQEAAADPEEQSNNAPAEDNSQNGEEGDLTEDTQADAQPVAPMQARPVQQAVGQFPDQREIPVSFGAVTTLQEEVPRATWRMEGTGGALALRFAEGEGVVTVISSLRPADNWHIDQADNAEFFWLLVGAGDHAPAHQEELIFVRRVDAPNLWQWLLRHARPALITAGVFLLFVLWRVIPRFGPLAAESPRGVRSLYQHLAASGRFLYRHRRQARLMGALREECLQQLLRAAPEARQMEMEARLQVAARMSGLPPKVLIEAFSATPRNAHEFLAATRTLARVRESLLGWAHQRQAR